MKKMLPRLHAIALIFLSLDICVAQRIRTCEEPLACISMNYCPPVQDLLATTSQWDVQQFRRAICDFDGPNIYVCCPTGFPEPRMRTDSSLLPKSCGLPKVPNKIFGGTPVPMGVFPWLVALGYKKPGDSALVFDCGGSIINYRYVLTAAHCVDKRKLGRRRLSVAYLGVRDLRTTQDCAVTSTGEKCYPHITAGIEEVVIHPDYDVREESSDDIAILRLNITINFDDPKVLVQPVCLPSNNNLARVFVSYASRRAIAAGWGLTEKNRKSQIVLSTKVPIVNIQQCIDIFGSQFVGNQLCVGGERGFDTCGGDSGGPLVLPDRSEPPYTQIGIVSFGTIPCGVPGRPSVYTSVADYKDWIVSNMRP